MMNPLDDFIKNNKEELNEQFDHAPSANLWQKINQTLQEENKVESTPKEIKQEKSIRITYANLWKVAAVLFLAITSVLIFQKYNAQHTTGNEMAHKLPSLQEINPELAKAEVYYTSLVQEKRKELRQLSPETLLEFDKELKALDSLYTGLKLEFYQNINQEQLANAMIENLRIRVDILNRQINILEKYKSKHAKKDEKVNI